MIANERNIGSTYSEVKVKTSTISADLNQLATTAAELAKLLGISERHLWAMNANGRLGPEPFAFGRSKRWSVDEVRRWLAAGAPSRNQWSEMKSAR